MSITNPASEPVSIDAIIGERVHQLMWRAQVTQTALAPMLSIGQSALSAKLRGRRGWSTDEVLKLAARFNVSIDYLFGRTDDMGAGPVNLAPLDYMAAVSAEVIDLASRRASA